MFAAAVALPAGLAAVAPTSAHAGSVTKHSGFWFAMTSGETFTQVVKSAAQRSPAQVVTTLHRMLQLQEAGQAVDIPKTRNGTIVIAKASRSDLTTALDAAERTAIKTAAIARNAQPARPLAAPQAAWPIRGESCNSAHSWCDMTFALAGGVRDPSCHETDGLAGSVTVDPSALGNNVVTWTIIYFPNNGNFSGYHFQWYVLKFAAQNQCGTGNSSS